MSISKVTKELGCSVTLFPNFYVFQELHSGKVKKIDKEKGGLYLLFNQLTKTIERSSSFVPKNNDLLKILTLLCGKNSLATYLLRY